MSDKSVVIVGAGHAGVQAAGRLRELGWHGGVIIIDQESHAPYERPPLSKDLLKPDAQDDSALLRKASYFQDKDITLKPATSVLQIDRQKRMVALSDGSGLPYHRLVLATGSSARKLTIPGSELAGVQVLKTKTDALTLKSGLIAGSKVVILGAGYIGLEVAAAAAARGCNVTVLEFQDRVMNRVTSSVVSHYFQKLHESHGIRFAFGSAASHIEGDGRAERVFTTDGAMFEADVVLVGIGVVPHQGLAENAGLECNDGILVDENGLTSDPYVYAAGDVTRSICPFEGTSRRLECIQNALSQADQVASHILGLEPKKPEVPWFWTIQHGLRLQTAGIQQPEDEVLLRGNPADGRFSVLYLRSGRLAAIDTVGGLADFLPGKKLIAAGVELDRTLAADPGAGLAQSARPVAA